MPRSRWEYIVRVFDNPRQMSTILNEAGEQGWEAVGITMNADGKYVVLLKRPAS